MSNNEEIDFYEILEVSPNASQETINRMYRFFAQRYHPDRREAGNAEKFAQICEAHDVLKDPEKRVAYDIRHKKNSEFHWHLVEEAGDTGRFDNDVVIQERVLSVMYVKRKRDTKNPGCGNMELERLTGCTREILDFHLWYLKEKGWIIRLEDGFLAITAAGVDKTLVDRPKGETNKLLSDNLSSATRGPLKRVF